jgi:sortase A
VQKKILKRSDEKEKRSALHKVNNFLTVIVVGPCLYLLLAPFWPKVTFEFKDEPPLVKQNESNPPTIPDQNTLVIPSMKLQETIYEGQNVSVLSKGIWHRPRSSTPENGGNTVLTGHRFTYGGPAVLYHIDKVQVGDKITVYWEHKKYEYRVETISVVSSNSREAEQETTDARLTIYTCTPLITAKNRLIVVAKPWEEE